MCCYGIASRCPGANTGTHKQGNFGCPETRLIPLVGSEHLGVFAVSEKWYPRKKKKKKDKETIGTDTATLVKLFFCQKIAFEESGRIMTLTKTKVAPSAYLIKFE